jgi:hypothetical protein
MALRKIQDGVQSQISLKIQKSEIERKFLLQKSLFSQCFRFQVRLKKIEIQEFLNFKNLLIWLCLNSSFNDSPLQKVKILTVGKTFF